MSIAAKVLPNNFNWEHPDFEQNKVSNPNKTAIHIPNTRICWGFEEWNFNPRMLEMKIGYLDCFREEKLSKDNLFKEENNVCIFYRNPNNRNTYLIATLRKVCKIYDNEIPEIREILKNHKWMSEVEKHFVQYPEQFNRYKRNYSNNFTTPNPNFAESPSNIFPFNIRYESIDFQKTPLLRNDFRKFKYLRVKYGIYLSEDLDKLFENIPDL